MPKPTLGQVGVDHHLVRGAGRARPRSSSNDARRASGSREVEPRSTSAYADALVGAAPGDAVAPLDGRRHVAAERGRDVVEAAAAAPVLAALRGPAAVVRVERLDDAARARLEA